jgi:hypothetical protein
MTDAAAHNPAFGNPPPKRSRPHQPGPSRFQPAHPEVAKPSRSAVVAMVLTNPGLTVGPIPTAKYPCGYDRRYIRDEFGKLEFQKRIIDLPSAQ